MFTQFVKSRLALKRYRNGPFAQKRQRTERLFVLR